MNLPQTWAEAFNRMRPPCATETWVPIRYVQADTFCWFCGAEIPRAKPGTRTGERGTKAWLCRERGVCECMPCRSRAKEAGL
ncbi:MAG TPA: hypothetical protein VN903_28600 [Polyangia bacterium]|nr:hypothetical protein [Polyangia bacterium]